MDAKSLAKKQARSVFLWALRGTARPNLLYRTYRTPVIHTLPQKLLVIRPDHLGDVLWITPALNLLRKALPQTEISVLVGSWGAATLDNNSDLDRIVRCEFPGFSRQPSRSWFEPYLYALQQSRLLRTYGYDAAINLRYDFWWGALLMYLADLPLRVGYAWPEAAKFLTHSLTWPPPNLLAEDLIPYRQTVHHSATLNMTLAAFALKNFGVDLNTLALSEEDWRVKFAPTAEDIRFVHLHLSEWGINPADKMVVIHPGSGASIKLWTNAQFAALADQLAARYATKVVLAGGPSEHTLLQAITDLTQTKPLLWEMGGLGRLGALFGRAKLVIGLDSGPLHLAVATAPATIQLFGPTDPQIFGPWGDAHLHRIVRTNISLPCLPCGILDFQRQLSYGGYCMRSISLNQVLEIAQELLRSA